LKTGDVERGKIERRRERDVESELGEGERETGGRGGGRERDIGLPRGCHVLRCRSPDSTRIFSVELLPQSCQ